MHSVRRKKSIYGPWIVQSPSGETMFRCADKKAKWYLKRNLAVVIPENSHVIRFTFDPKGTGHIGDNYNLNEMANKCVCCGDEDIDSLTKHHVVPYFYRRAFPENLKNYNFHDILPMCGECHREYEKCSWSLRQQLALRYDAPLAVKKQIDKDKHFAKKYANAILKYGDKMPIVRKEQLYDHLKKHLKKSNISEEDLMSCMEEERVDNKEYVRHGEIVIKKIGVENLQGFVEMWRSHFIINAKPQFLPKNWDLRRKIGT